MTQQMNQFFTREKANEGIKLPLSLPDGQPSEHYLVIRGVDSDAFREAETETKRNAMTFASIEDDAERKAAMVNEKLTLIASLVSDWSFDQDCTQDSIKELLREAPQIADQIDQVASKRALFFGKGLSNLSATQKRKSGSTVRKKTQKAPESKP